MKNTCRPAATLVAFVALALPFVASAASIDELRAQIQALLTQIAALQAQMRVSQSPTSAPVVSSDSANQCNFARTLSLGASGQDVATLQQYLIRQNFLAAGFATGQFDTRTETAVQGWQASHGIVFSGTPETTGYGVAGPRTRALLSINCALPTASSGVPATCPIAPQPTTVCSVGWQAVTDSYGCTTSYRCAIPLPGAALNACSAITLSCPAGTRVQTKADCSESCVSGILSPSPSALGAFSASPASGPASLAVTFYATDLTPDTYSVNFGDGSSSTQMIPQSCANTTPNACTYLVGHVYGATGVFTATLSSARAGQLKTVLVTAY